MRLLSKNSQTLLIKASLFAVLLSLSAFLIRALAVLFSSEASVNILFILGSGLGVFVSLLYGQILGVFIFLIPLRFLRNVFLFTLTFGTLLLFLASTEFFLFSGTLPSLESAKPLFFLGSTDSGLQSSLAERWSFFFLLLLAMAFSASVNRLVSGSLKRVGKIRVGLVFTILFLISLGLNSSLQVIPKGPVYLGAIHPLHHAFAKRSLEISIQGGEEKKKLSILELAEKVSSEISSERRGDLINPKYPFCRKEVQGKSEKKEKREDIILLVLESVGSRALDLKHQGKFVMPSLRKISKEGLSFHRFHANGYTSTQALPGIFSGISAETHQKILYHAPLIPLDGLPRKLKEAGYDSVYFHGSDLSFDQQRGYLRKAGFDEIIEPQPFEEKEIIGWGIPDGPMLDRLKSWILDHREKKSGSPYFATLFTITSHDPYDVPDNTTNESFGNTRYEKYLSTLAYLDRELGSFYQWFKETEAKRGAKLLILGDHVPRLRFPYESSQTNTGEFEYRFRIPLMVSGFNGNVSKADFEERVGGQLDIAPTILGIVGLGGEENCFMGRDLLSPGFPEDRVVVSMAGEGLEFMVLHQKSKRWMLHLQTGKVQLHDVDRDPGLEKDLFDPGSEEWKKLKVFAKNYLELGRYLNLAEGYAPKKSLRLPEKKNLKDSEFRLVSHRGNTSGPDSEKENSLEALEDAYQKGFRWVEIDLQLTWDGFPILFHDRQIEDQEGKKVAVNGLTFDQIRRLPMGKKVEKLEEVLKKYDGKLNFCLELKDQNNYLPNQKLVRAVLRDLKKHIEKSDIILDSFDRRMLQSVRVFSDWETAFDLPQKKIKKYVLEYAAENHFDWVYVRHDLLNEENVRWANDLGLRIMAYTANTSEDIMRLKGLGVEGIMTDRKGL